ncbi:CHC2 zinc finger domain-containing protein [Collinsella aerofaciens]|uniref:CHC2 zinc finger domain-containing protein n=1 Tax=Collinsella aerofaciens TaxID=74426 RepID=UPI003D655A95
MQGCTRSKAASKRKTVCPFHNDKNPSMKVDKRLHCFVCQADGDTVDFASRL